MRIRLVAILTVCLFASPTRANTTAAVDLKVDLTKQVALEKRLKELIDKWAEPGLDITFKARPAYSLDEPGMVRVFLDDLKATTNDGWYRDYRALYDELVKQPFALEVLRHAQAYCRGGTIYMVAECLDAGGKAVFKTPVHNLYSMCRAQDTLNFYFVHHQGVPLPAAAPTLGYLNHSTVSDPIWLELPAKVAPSVVKIHLKDQPARTWPVPLDGK